MASLPALKVEKVGAWKLPDGTLTEKAEVAKKAIQLLVVQSVVREVTLVREPETSAELIAKEVAARLDEINLAVTEAMK